MDAFFEMLIEPIRAYKPLMDRPESNYTNY